MSYSSPARYAESENVELVKSYFSYIASPEGQDVAAETPARPDLRLPARAGRRGDRLDPVVGRARPRRFHRNAGSGTACSPIESEDPADEHRNRPDQGETATRRPRLLALRGLRRVDDPRDARRRRDLPDRAEHPALFANSEDASILDTSFWPYVGLLVFGTIWAAALALLIAVPISIGIALFISHYAPRRPPRCSATSSTCSPRCPRWCSASGASASSRPPCSRSTPGSSRTWAGSAVLRPVSGTGRTILTAAIVLAVMVIPIITAICREVFLQTPCSTRRRRSRSARPAGR